MAAPSDADRESTSEDDGLYRTIQRRAITPTIQDRVNADQTLEHTSRFPVTTISRQARHAIGMLNNARLDLALRLGKTLEDMMFNEAELAWQWDGMQSSVVQAYNRGELPVLNRGAQMVRDGRTTRLPTRSLSPEVDDQPPPNAEINNQPSPPLGSDPSGNESNAEVDIQRPPNPEVDDQPSPTLSSNHLGNGSNAEGSSVPAEGDCDFRTLRLPLQLAMRMKDAIEKMEVRATNWNDLLELLGKRPPPTLGETEESFNIVSEFISDLLTTEAICQDKLTVPEEITHLLMQRLPAFNASSHGNPGARRIC